MPSLGGNGLDDPEVIADLRTHGAVGDVCANYFRIDGKPCDASITKRTITIDPAILHTVKRVIAVAGGIEKVNSIIGALNGRYVNMLVTDMSTAQAILAQT
jgi:DNA-binding transcriptional regulator LsrR (DeoR family)